MGVPITPDKCKLFYVEYFNLIRHFLVPIKAKYVMDIGGDDAFQKAVYPVKELYSKRLLGRHLRKVFLSIHIFRCTVIFAKIDLTNFCEWKLKQGSYKVI